MVLSVCDNTTDDKNPFDYRDKNSNLNLCMKKNQISFL